MPPPVPWHGVEEDGRSESWRHSHKNSRYIYAKESGERFEVSEAAQEDQPFDEAGMLKDEPKEDEPVIVVFGVWSTCARSFERAASAATDAVLLIVRGKREVLMYGSS